MKKKNLNDLSYILKVLLPALLFSACFAFLYNFDVITPTIFDLLTQLVGFIFYILLANLLNKLLPKKTFILQIIIVLILSFVYMTTQPIDIISIIIFTAKMVTFVTTLLLIKKKNHK